MRILRIHNRYQHRGGEDVSFEAEVALLKRQGHDVECLEFTNDDISARQSFLDRLDLAKSTIWSQKARDQIAAAIILHRPDVSHFDNTFPLVSPAAYSVCQQFGVPVVQSLRNYRLLCPSANFYRDGHVCEDCLGKTPPYPGVVHGCYRNSRAQTTVVAAMLTAHGLRRTWLRDVDRYVALSDFAKSKLIEGGLPSNLISVKPNFVDLQPPNQKPRSENMLYVGRLTQEKGIGTLISAWKALSSVPLVVIGDGPMRAEVTAAAQLQPSLSYVGRKPEATTYSLMSQAKAVVVPSEWYEPFGRVVIESFAVGTPVIASRSGGIAELVENGKTGLLFEAGNATDIAAKIRWADEHPQEMREMGENARRVYELEYNPERNYEMLMDVYQQAIEHARRR